MGVCETLEERPEGCEAKPEGVNAKPEVVEAKPEVVEAKPYKEQPELDAALARVQARVAAEDEDLFEQFKLFKKAEEAEKQRLFEDAETVRLSFSSPDGDFFEEGRLNGTLDEVKTKIGPKCGLPGAFSTDPLELFVSGYKLEPQDKMLRLFTELCEVVRL